MHSISTAEIGDRIDDILEEAEREIVQITQNNNPKAVIDMMKDIRQAQREITNGKHTDWEDFKLSEGVYWF